ncbi:MAG TPA: alpha/beta fold hydrolase [Baekduia sp.]|nr:alpha/beta fold hydrolase [Baekduia sp.]
MPEISDARFRAGEGEPLVLIHGFTATWRCWTPLLAELVPRFDVFAPTLSGHDGGPDHPAGVPMSMAGAAELLERQLDEQGIETAHLVGNSLGGALAIELARRGRARSVTAISPGAGWTDPLEGERIVRFFRRTQRLARMSAPRAHVLLRRPGSRRLAFRDVMLRGELVQPHEAVALVRSSVRCRVVDLVFDAIRQGTAMLDHMGDVDAPVLVAWGRHDRILPLERHAPRFRSELRGVDFRVLERCGHTPMWDDPPLLVRTILDGVAAARPTAAPAPA